MNGRAGAEPATPPPVREAHPGNRNGNEFEERPRTSPDGAHPVGGTGIEAVGRGGGEPCDRRGLARKVAELLDSFESGSGRGRERVGVVLAGGVGTGVGTREHGLKVSMV